jgi:hypothetical protein
MSNWGLYLSDAEHNVVSIDFGPGQYHFERFHLPEHKTLYFNNRPLRPEKLNDETIPLGNKEQCKMREKSFECLMRKHDFNGIPLPHILSDLDVNKNANHDSWNLPVSTIATIQNLSFNFHQDKSYYILGEAPKVKATQLLCYQNIFTSDLTQENTPITEAKKFTNGYSAWSKAQAYWDNGEYELAYHQLQMAIVLLADSPEAEICQFYLLVWQYMNLSSAPDYKMLHIEFQSIQSNLPPYLSDHCLLFLLRLEKLLDYKLENMADKIHHPQLKEMYQREYKLRPFVIKFLKKLIFPRMDILDIIYSY